AERSLPTAFEDIHPSVPAHVDKIDLTTNRTHMPHATSNPSHWPTHGQFEDSARIPFPCRVRAPLQYSHRSMQQRERVDRRRFYPAMSKGISEQANRLLGQVRRPVGLLANLCNSVFHP